MPDYKKITDLDLVTTVSDDDLFIVETATGTKSVKIETFRDTEVTKESIGLGNVDNTSDLNKPISTATQTALNAKANTTDVASTYLSKTDAQNTYLTQNTATGTYLTRADASTTYLTQSSASSTYATQTALSTGLSSKADSATTIAGYGITDAYTKTEVDSKTTNALIYKGTVATYDNLPTAGLTIGDLYTVTDTGAKYFWNGSTWQKMGDNVDISLYLTKSEASSTYLTQASASSTYATQSTLSGYETSVHASSTYLSLADASTNYATKTELSGKQNVLTAGNNISISGSTISATDTTYTAGAGISIVNGVITNTQNTASWGNITGTLSNQTDLQTALSSKIGLGNLSIDTASANYLAYDGTNGKFSAKVDTDVTSSSSKLITSGAVYTAIDTIATRSYTADCPALTSTSGVCTWTITHGLGTRNVIATLYSNGNEIDKNVTLTSDSSITVTFYSSTNVSAGDYKILIVAPSIYTTQNDNNLWVSCAKSLWDNASIGGMVGGEPSTYQLDLSDTIPNKNAQYEVIGWLNHGAINIMMDTNVASDQCGCYYSTNNSVNIKDNIIFVLNGSDPRINVRSYLSATGVYFGIRAYRRVG